MHTELHVVHNCQPAAFSCLNPRELVEQPGFCISAGTAKKGSTSHGGEGSWAELCFPQRVMIYTSLHKKNSDHFSVPLKQEHFTKQRSPGPWSFMLLSNKTCEGVPSCTKQYKKQRKHYFPTSAYQVSRLHSVCSAISAFLGAVIQF